MLERQSLRVKNRFLIALAVQDARDKDGRFVRPVVDDVALHRKAAKTRCDIVTRSASIRMRG